MSGLGQQQTLAAWQLWWALLVLSEGDATEGSRRDQVALTVSNDRDAMTPDGMQHLALGDAETGAQHSDADIFHGNHAERGEVSWFINYSVAYGRKGGAGYCWSGVPAHGTFSSGPSR